MARIVVDRRRGGRPRHRRPAGRSRAPGDRLRAGRHGRRQARPVRARHPGRLVPLRHRAEPAHPAAGLPRPVRGDRGEARRIPGPGAAGPDRPARLPRRRPDARLVRRPGEFAARIGAALGDRAAADWQRLWRRAARVWHASWRDILRRTVDSPRDLAALAWRRRRPGRHRPGPHPARAGPPAPVRPAAADAAGPVRHLHRRRPAPGPGRAGRGPLRRADLRRLVPARRAGHARRRAADAAAWTSAWSCRPAPR